MAKQLQIEQVQTIVRLDADLKAALKRLRDERGIVTNRVINDAVRHWLSDYFELPALRARRERKER